MLAFMAQDAAGQDGMAVGLSDGPRFRDRAGLGFAMRGAKPEAELDCGAYRPGLGLQAGRKPLPAQSGAGLGVPSRAQS